MTAVAVGDTVLVNVDPDLNGGATTAGALVCRVWAGDPEAEPEDIDAKDRIAVWVFADYTTAPVLRQDLVEADGGVLPEPKKRDNGVRDLTVWAPKTAPAADAPAEPATEPDPSTEGSAA